MPESHRIPPPRNDADPLARDTRLAALADDGGAEAFPAFANRRRLAIARLEADG